MHPTGGAPGWLLPPLNQNNLQELTNHNSFRHDLRVTKSQQQVWPIALLLCSIAFFVDVFVRRVAIDVALPWNWLRARMRGGLSEADLQRRNSLERLTSTKAKLNPPSNSPGYAIVVGEVPQSNGATQESSKSLGDVGNVTESRKSPSTAIADAPKLTDQNTSYTARLLRAKKQARRTPT